MIESLRSTNQTFHVCYLGIRYQYQMRAYMNIPHLSQRRILVFQN